MSENHQINLNINAANAERGAAKYKAAINQITSATKAYKAALDQLDSNKSKVDFSKLAKELNALSSFRINSSLAKNINSVGSALRGFRGPSASQLKGTREFLRTLAQAQVNTSVARNVAAVSAAFSNFRGPTRNNAAAIQDLFKALNGSRLNPQTAAQLAAITQALANFRGPSAASVRNIDGLVNAINNLRTPPNLSGVAAALNAIAAAGARANGNVNRLTQAHNNNSAAARRSSSSAIKLTGDMRGLENAFSLSYQAGSQLRVLFGSLTFSEFTRGVYNATLAVQRFQTTMGVTASNLAEVQSQMNFATGVADKYGVSIAGVYDEYGKFATAAKLAGQSTENVQYIFESVSSAMRVMGTDAQGQQRVFRALTQMFSKGAVRAEELVQQIGEQIPGAFQVMQDALSENLGRKVDLAKMLELGQVDDSAVVLFAEKLGSIFGPKVAEAMERADSWVARLQNSWFKFQKLVGEGGVQQAIGDVSKQLSELMESEAFRANAACLAKALGDGIRLIGDGAAWAVTHTKELGAIVLAFLTTNIVTTVGRIATGFMDVAKAGGLLSFAFMSIPLAIGAATSALAYFWDATVRVGDTQSTVGAMATQAWHDVKNYVLNASDSVNGFSLQGIIDWIVLADSSTATGFQNIQQNGQLTADKIRALFGNLAKIIGAEVTKIFLQFGVASNKLIATAARNMDYYTKKVFQPWKSEETLLSEYNANLGNDFKILNETLDSGSAEIDKFFGVDRAKSESYDILAPIVEQYAKRANELQALRDQEANKEAAARKAREEARSKEARDTLGRRPEGNIDPLREGSGAGGKDSVSKRLKESQKATANYKAEVDALTQSLRAGDITLDQYNRGLEYQARKLQESADPYAAMIRSMENEANLSNMATRAREVEIAHREKINDLAEKGVQVTAEQSNKIRQLIAAQQKMNNRPLKDWVDGIEDVGVATDKVAVSAIEGLSDEIATMVATGKADFASLAQSILKEFIKVGIQQAAKKLFGDWFGGKDTLDAQKNLSTPAKDVFGAQASNIALKAQDWGMRGAFGLRGDPQQAAVEDGLAALKRSSMGLRGSLDLNGNPDLKASLAIAAPQIDTMTTSAINAATALNTLAGAANGHTPLGQPFPGASSNPLAVSQSPARVAATPFNLSNKTLTLTPQEITDLKKTLMTEVDAGLKGAAYDGQAAGVVDTILNRKVSGRWGNSVTSVVNAKSQFSDINGPVAWKNGRGGVEYLSDSLLQSGRGARASKFVDDYLAKRMSGAPSSVGGNLHYANPNYADAANRAWIDNLQGPSFGEGSRIHKHGTTAGFQPVDSNYAVKMAGQPMTSTPGIQGIPGLNWNGKMMSDVKGLTLHHTGGRGTPNDVINTLNQRGFGAQFIMDRDGSIYQTVPDGAQVSHMKNAENGSGLNNSNALGIEMIARDNADLTDAQKQAGVKWIEQMKAKYPGIGDNVFGHGELNSHKREDEGMGVVSLYRQQQQGAVDPQTTGSIQQVNTQLQTLGQTAQQVAQQTQTAQQTTAIATQQKVAADQQAGLAVQTAGQQALQASPNFQTAGQSIASAGQTASQAQPGFQEMSSGLGALLGPLSSVVPGLGQFGGAIMSLLGSMGGTGGGLGSLFGLFKEGGLATQPVALGKMPHFAEGTANTGSYGRGGIPSVLHPNEAVIPLSRGRKVPVEMNTREPKTEQSEFAAAKSGSPVFNLNLHGIKSADDFKRSQRQINQKLASAQERTMRRNS